MAKFSKERADIGRTLDGTEFGTSLKDLASGDLSRGYSSAEVEDGYGRSGNDGPIVAWEEGDSMPFDSPAYTEEEDRPGILERPGIGWSKSNVRRN